MNSLTSTVDVESLKCYYQSNSDGQVVLDHAASRVRNMSETTVDRIQTVLATEGTPLSRGQVIEVFKKLEELGCGKFVAGRRGFQSRFRWDVGLVSVGRTASGESQEIENVVPDEIDDEDDEMLIPHSYRLRPDLQVSLDLPANLTMAEANRLSEFVKTLPFSH